MMDLFMEKISVSMCCIFCFVMCCIFCIFWLLEMGKRGLFWGGLPAFSWASGGADEKPSGPVAFFVSHEKAHEKGAFSSARVGADEKPFFVGQRAGRRKRFFVGPPSGRRKNHFFMGHDRGRRKRLFFVEANEKIYIFLWDFFS